MLLETGRLAAAQLYDQSNLTRAQLVFWLGQKLNPGLPLYNAPFSLLIPKQIDENAFRRAFQKLVDNCDAMRTIVETHDGVPYQRVLPHVPYDLEVVDFSGEPAPRLRFILWAEERCRRVFEFERPMFDSVLVRLGPERYGWFFNQHHIICDGFTYIILVRYLSQLYESALDGTLDSIPPYPPFAEYVAYERSKRGEGGDPVERAYWEAKLSEKREPARFFGKAATLQVGVIDRIFCEFDHEVTEHISRMSHHLSAPGLSPHAARFNVIASAVLAYLYRMNGTSRPTIGMPFHNRRRDLDKFTPGIFMGVLPLTVSVQDDDTLESLVAKVALEASQNVRHSAYYFHNLLHTQAYEVLLNGLMWGLPVFADVPCQVEWPNIGYGLDTFVFNFFDNPNTRNFGIGFFFNRNTFAESEQWAVVDQFGRLLENMVREPARSIGEMDLMSAREKQRLLVDLNRTDEPFAEHCGIHNLFEEQVRRDPHAPAVFFEGATLTYGELDARANQLAHYLRDQGVGRESLVGISVERSIDLIVALIGVLKAGGAYLPLDPAYPDDRLLFMLGDARVKLLLTQDSLKHRFLGANAAVVSLDAERSAIASYPSRDPLVAVAPNNLAYAVYTSGSTGRPKGVLIEHRGVCNTVQHNSRAVGLGPGKRVLQFTSISFDPSVCEIFGALTTGAALYVPRQDVVADGRALTEFLSRHRITTLLVVPAVLSVLAPDELPDLETVVVGGEPCSQALVDRWALGRKMFNAYGPTEASICATMAECRAGVPGPPPIGKPIANTRVYVLDWARRPVPVGTPGELYVGGVGVGRGYLNRPELTAERFLPDPFSRDPGARMYKTGDRVRMLPDGNLEFLGRLDNQVKLRGFRIELEEIENVLRRHPEISDTVVVLDQPAAGDAALVAYVVPRRNDHQFDGELKVYLKQTLPDYMVPRAFVVLDRLPMGPNAKVDRDALPKPDHQTRCTSTPAVAARDSLEMELVQIWEQVLNVSPVGVKDHFFDLGGHSLSAVHLMERIQERLGVRLPATKLFSAPTIESLAAALRAAIPDSPEPIVVPIQPRGHKMPFYCVHPAPGTVFCYMPLARHLGFDRPIYGLQAPSVNGYGKVFDSIEEAAARYVEALLDFQPEGPYFLGGHSSGGTIAFEMARRLKAAGHDVGAVVLFDSMAPYPAPRPVDLYSLMIRASDQAVWLSSVALLVRYFFNRDVNITYNDLVRLEPEQQIALVLNLLKEVGFLAPTAGPGAIRGLVDNFSTSMYASMCYRPEPYDGKVLYLKTKNLFADSPEGIWLPSLRQFFGLARGNGRVILRDLPKMIRDLAVSVGRFAVLRRVFSTPALGWERYCRQPIEVRPVPGNHVTMLVEPAVQALAETLRRHLDAIDPGLPMPPPDRKRESALRPAQSSR